MRRKSSETPTHTTQEVSTVTGAGDQQLRRSTQSIAPSAGMARGYTRKKRIFYSYQIIWYVLSLMEIILSFRFVLKLLGANPSSGFATFIYGLSRPVVQPFLTLFTPSVTRGAETVGYLEWSTPIAALVYALVAWGIIELIKLGKPVSPEDIEQGIRQE